MKVLLDTNVIFPAVTVGHPNHNICTALITRLAGEAEIVVLSTHLIAELYSNLTRIPNLKIAPADAGVVIFNLVDRFSSVELSEEDYLAAVDRCTGLNLSGAVIYDALHFQAAIKGAVDILYTFNLKAFERLMTEEVAFEVKAPN